MIEKNVFFLMKKLISVYRILFLYNFYMRVRWLLFLINTNVLYFCTKVIFIILYKNCIYSIISDIESIERNKAFKLNIYLLTILYI